ncbi:MAG: hypothetical protein M0Z30_06160 [Actinomycetota bacterium]|nr:hypothetical protein [Actinomycetota bacterium]
MFHAQINDQLFPFNGQRALFDLLGSTDKVLLGAPGAHGDNPPTAITLCRAFISERL